MIKLPIAIAVLRGVDAGEIALEDTVALRVADLRAGHSPLAEGHPEGLRVTVGELLRAAISDSDNTASDALLRLAGGAEAVTHVLRELEVDGVRVDRGYAQFFWDYNGVGDPPEPERWTPALFDSVGDAVPVAARDAAAKRFAEDDRDTGTPCGLASLFARLARGELLGWRSTQLLLGWMTRSANTATRIVAGIPAGTTVSHKTGTWGSDEGLVAVNDVGIVTLPDGRRVALAILVAAAERPLQEVERAMADVTRTVYDTWPGTRADEAENVDGDHSSKEAQA